MGRGGGLILYTQVEQRIWSRRSENRPAVWFPALPAAAPQTPARRRVWRRCRRRSPSDPAGRVLPTTRTVSTSPSGVRNWMKVKAKSSPRPVPVPEACCPVSVVSAAVCVSEGCVSWPPPSCWSVLCWSAVPEIWVPVCVPVSDPVPVPSVPVCVSAPVVSAPVCVPAPVVSAPVCVPVPVVSAPVCVPAPVVSAPVCVRCRSCPRPFASRCRSCPRPFASRCRSCPRPFASRCRSCPRPFGPGARRVRARLRPAAGRVRARLRPGARRVRARLRPGARRAGPGLRSRPGALRHDAGSQRRRHSFRQIAMSRASSPRSAARRCKPLTQKFRPSGSASRSNPLRSGA